MPVNTLIQIRKGTDSEWTSTNPVLGSGEPGFITDQFRLKIGDGTTDWQNLNYIGSNESLYQVRNETGSVLYAGQGVYASGIHANKVISTNLYVSNGTIPDHMFMGLVTNNISNNNFGYVTHFGQINGLNTTGSASNISAGGETWTNGTLLYASASSAGKLTSVKPIEAILVAIVLYAHATQGKLFVRPTTEPHLDDLHDVSVSGSTNGQFLQYNSGSGLWLASSSGNFTNLQLNGTTVSVSGHTHNSSDISNFNTSVSGLLPTISNSGDNRVLTSTGSSVGINAESNLTFDGNLLNVVGSGIFASGLNISNQTASTIASFDANKNMISLSTATYPSLTELSYIKGTTSSIQTQLNSKQNTLTNPVTGTGIANHIAYWNSSSGIVADSGQLYWDSTNNRLGVGTNSPSVSLDVSGTAAFGSNILGRIIFGEESFGGELGFFDNNDNTLAIRYADGSFQYGGGSPGTANLIVTASGDVGIGTGAPSEKLEVNGVLKTAGFKSYTDGNSWFGSSDGSVGIATNINPSGTWSSLVPFANFQGFNDAVSSYNPICFTTQNGPQLYLNTDGNIGIGTTSPIKKLDVNGSIRSSDGISDLVLGYDINLDQYGLINYSNNNLFINSDNAPIYELSPFGITIDGDASNTILQPNTGSVGIGTLSPSYTLDVNGGGNFTSLNVNNVAVSISGHTHSSSNIIDFGPSVSGLITGTANYISKFRTSNSGIINSQIFDNGTNIGIGTASPSGKLHISGTQLIDGRLSIGQSSFPVNIAPSSLLHINGQVTDFGSLIITGQTSSNTILGWGNNNTVPYFSVVNGDLSSSTFGWGMFYRSTEGDFRLSRKGGTTSWIDCLNIQRSNGNVGIGSGTQATSPAERLVVDGNLRLSDTAENRLQFYRGGGTADDYTIRYGGAAGAYALQISTSNDSTTQRCVHFGSHTAGTFTGKTSINGWTGNVGIGTITPNAASRLTVAGSGNTSSSASISVINSSSTNIFYVRDDGNVGIGTSSPGSKLDVNGNVNIDGNLTFDSFTESVVAIGNSSTSKTLDLTTGTVQTCTLTGNCVFTMPTATAGKSFTLFLSTGAGSFTGTFTGVRWAGGTAPTITTTASKVDILSFISDGSFWYGSYSQNYG